MLHGSVRVDSVDGSPFSLRSTHGSGLEAFPSPALANIIITAIILWCNIVRRLTMIIKRTPLRSTKSFTSRMINGFKVTLSTSSKKVTMQYRRRNGPCPSYRGAYIW